MTVNTVRSKMVFYNLYRKEWELCIFSLLCPRYFSNLNITCKIIIWKVVFIKHCNFQSISCYKRCVNCASKYGKIVILLPLHGHNFIIISSSSSHSIRAIQTLQVLQNKILHLYERSYITRTWLVTPKFSLIKACIPDYVSSVHNLSCCWVPLYPWCI
jgi:hypothetical protein